jgi:hypothetical protein
MEIESKLIGDLCPTCGDPLQRRPRMFFWRGTHSDGAVCERCNALWSIAGEEMEPLRPRRVLQTLG